MKQFFILIILVMLTAFQISAQTMPPVPVDSALRVGKLENGLTYYIRHNKEPRERAEFYIVQNVGAILEDDSQNGLAHFLEHMAFNGTKNFPEKEVIRFLERQGVKFGENINAYTSLDETVYNLSNVPVTNESVIDSSLMILHDWSGFISLLENEIDSERGVIREEWRQGASADRRMWKESNKQKYPGSQYSKRDVIGDTAVINNFTYQSLRDYYKKWYRPDLQAIIVVGDIDVNSIEGKIKSMFADIPAQVNPAERIVYQIENNKEPIVSIVTDKEARMTRIGVEYKHDKLPVEVRKSLGGYIVGLMNNLISMMMSERINENSQQANAAYVGGYVQYGEMIKAKDAFEMIVVPKEGNELAGLEAMFTDLEKLKRFGFTNGELDRAKTNLLKGTEKAYNERNTRKNNSFVREYTGNFLNDELIPGIEWEYRTVQTVLPYLKLEQINDLARNYITDENMVVYIMAPAKTEVKVPSKEEVLASINSVKSKEIEAPREENLNRPLIEQLPKVGKLSKITKDDVLGTVHWELKNGATVIFKTTDFKEDEIKMTAFSKGGISKVKEIADLYSADFAENIPGTNGLGTFNQVELGKVLTGKIASVNAYIKEYEEGLNGGSSVKDFETMLQLTYLNFTGARKDDNAFEAMINMYKAMLANSANDPRRAFSDTLIRMTTNHHPRTLISSVETLSKVNQDKALEIFKSRFSDVSDFTFVFTGNIDPEDEKVKEQILTYIGGLKSKKVSENYTDNMVRKPRGLVENYFARPMEIKKATNYILYSGYLKYNLENSVLMGVLGDLLRLRYTETIREKEGGSYGVAVRGALSNTPVDEATLYMYFDTDPEKQKRLMKLIHNEIDSIITNGPIATDLEKVKGNLLKKQEENLRENSWWQSVVRAKQEDNIDYFSDYKEVVESLTADKVKETLMKIVEQGNILEVVMKPQD